MNSEGTFYRVDPGEEGALKLTQWRGPKPTIDYPGIMWVPDPVEEQ